MYTVIMLCIYISPAPKAASVAKSLPQLFQGAGAPQRCAPNEQSRNREVLGVRLEPILIFGG